jgi:2-oxoglutarate dehydrogenase E2 component (dihydrolipoamide succinyltransferase)
MASIAAADDADGSGGHAVLVRWLRRDGDRVAVDEPICELETGTANVDMPAPSAGILRHLKRAGEPVQAGEEIGRIDPAP